MKKILITLYDVILFKSDLCIISNLKYANSKNKLWFLIVFLNKFVVDIRKSV